MKRYAFIGGALIFALTTGFITIDETTSYTRTGNSLSTFGSVFREVSTRYVDWIDPEVLIDASIDGMMSKLDPYSEFLRENEREDMDQITNGVYTGFGINVVSRDGHLLIAGVRDGYSASYAGVRIGDRLVKIDSVVTDTMTPRSLRMHTRGAPGSYANIKLVREGRLDTLSMRVQRSEIPVENVAIAQRLDNSIGYIKLMRFSRRADDEVRRSIERLRAQGPLSGLILDLRDNPGGLLEAAVEIVRLFVPEGSPIVTTKSRNAEDNRVYRSMGLPMEPTLPLTVLINERSASASEIVAGAIQDLDRGVVIGARSFGKGLVQTMASMTDDAALKLTTSRYYTPSGRSIQNIDYVLARETGDKATATTKEGQKFHTKNGREVIELHGIAPDTAISDSILPPPVHAVVRGFLLFRYVTITTANWNALPQGFVADKGMVESFIKWVESQPGDKKSSALADLVKTREKAIKEQWSPASIKALEQSEKTIEKELSRALRANSEEIRLVLDSEIHSRFEQEYISRSRELQYDRVIKAAQQILKSNKYAGILSGQVGEDQ